MVFFYEFRNHEHKTVILQDETCPICKNKGVLKMHFLQSYIWMFGPMIPSLKYAVLECESCQTTIPNKKWTKELDAIYKKEKATLKTPLRLWRGLIVISTTFLLLFGMMKSGIKNPFGLQDDQQIQTDSRERFQNIQLNDLIFVGFSDVNRKGTTKENGIMKVVSIDGNKIGAKVYTEKFDQANFGYDLKLSDVDDSKFEPEIKYFDAEKFKKNFNLHFTDNDDTFPFAYAKIIIFK